MREPLAEAVHEADDDVGLAIEGRLDEPKLPPDRSRVGPAMLRPD